MTGKLCRSIAAACLTVLITISPVAPVLGQNQASPAPQSPTQNPPSQQAPPASQSQTPGKGQTQPQSPVPFNIAAGPDFTRPKKPYFNVLAPYTPIQVDQPQFVNSPKLNDLIHDGKLQLSLRDAIQLALESNLDISVNRYWSWMAETDILRANGGGTQRGVQVSSVPQAFANIPTITFDPVVTGTLSLDSRRLPVNNPLTSGTGTASTSAAFLGTHSEIANLGYAQGFGTGTNLGLSLATTRSSSTSAAVFFNPAVQTTASISLTQQLLNGFSRLANERYIRMAILTKKSVDYAFAQTLITDITAVEDDYWELVFGRGNVDVQQRAVDLAQRLYEDNQRQVQVGTLAPIEIVRAEAQLATAQQALISARTAQLQQQTVLMSVITKNPTAPELRNVEIVPTETVQNPPQIETMTLTDAVNEALAKRPDVQEARVAIDGDNLNIKATRNALLPILSLSAVATGVGLNGMSKTLAPGGFTDAAGNALTGNSPEYFAQLALTLPIRNRVAQADSARSQLAERQDQARLQQAINNVAVDVQNAQITLEQDRAALVAAQKTRELQEQTLDADQRRLQVGASTIFIVVTDQQLLAVAAAAEVRAGVNLVEALVNFQRAMGRTLEANNITIADAKSGTVPRDTLIPGTNLTGELVGQRSNSSR
jgi:outer membrane protein